MNKQERIIECLKDYPDFIAEEAAAKEDKVLKTMKELVLDCTLCSTTVGKTYTLIELMPTVSIRISRLKKLVNDICMSLDALGVRLIAPIPGKGTIGIEVPNNKPQIIGLKKILKTPEFSKSAAQLPIAVGMDVKGKSVVADLATMPHLLVAGATGMGKTVFLNTLIVSLLAAKKPEELQLLLIDPKRVEYSPYKSIASSYLLKVEGIEDTIITDNEDVKAALEALCAEMERRNSLLINAGARTIADYNAKGYDKLPYIVVVIDEFADPILTLGKDIKTPIVRLAAEAHAVGIHIVLATMRPSKDIVTAGIKTNIPARIAFRTIQMVDSKAILDQEGAERLLGRGDMLFYQNGCITRLQGAFIYRPEVDKVVESLLELKDPSPDCSNKT